VVGAEDVLDGAAVEAVTDVDALFGVDEKTLAADGTADAGGEAGWLA
jgi:hypothetical protein